MSTEPFIARGIIEMRGENFGIQAGDRIGQRINFYRKAPCGTTIFYQGAQVIDAGRERVEILVTANTPVSYERRTS